MTLGGEATTVPPRARLDGTVVEDDEVKALIQGFLERAKEREAA